MLSGMPQVNIKSSEKRLLAAFRQLDASSQQTLHDFCDFLVQRNHVALPAEAIVTEPLGILRPEEESVVKAIKRLSKNYPMIDTSKMLDETAKLMSSHILQGRKAPEVIDELETLFERYFKATKNA